MGGAHVAHADAKFDPVPKGLPFLRVAPQVQFAMGRRLRPLACARQPAHVRAVGIKSYSQKFSKTCDCKAGLTACITQPVNKGTVAAVAQSRAASPVSPRGSSPTKAIGDHHPYAHHAEHQPGPSFTTLVCVVEEFGVKPKLDENGDRRQGLHPKGQRHAGRPCIAAG